MASDGQNEELVSLKTDLEQLVKLTEESLLELKKRNLLEHLGLLDEEKTCENVTNKASENIINTASENVTNKKDINDIVGESIF